MTLIEKAREFAHAAHDSIGQVRKYTGEPYWVHTDEVASLVSNVTLGAETPNDESIPEVAENHYRIMIAAAHLHDILEDVDKFPYEIVTISKTFGHEVAILVRELTDVFTSEKYPDMNRASRKEMEADRLSTISADAQTIKVADLLSNTKSIVDNDPGFAKTYLKEKEYLLSKLTKANPILLERAKIQLTEAKKRLNL